MHSPCRNQPSLATLPTHWMSLVSLVTVRFLRIPSEHSLVIVPSCFSRTRDRKRRRGTVTSVTGDTGAGGVQAHGLRGQRGFLRYGLLSLLRSPSGVGSVYCRMLVLTSSGGCDLSP